jgi:tetratricopeptide (TPR) repeat protein
VREALADGYARAGNFGAARTAYESALKFEPDDAELLNILANVLLALKDPGAIKIAEQALAINPGNSNNIDTLGWVLFQNGQTDKALQLLRDPASAEIRYHLAAALTQAGRKNEARDELEAALKGGISFEFSGQAKELLQTLK